MFVMAFGLFFADGITMILTATLFHERFGGLSLFALRNQLHYQTTLHRLQSCTILSIQCSADWLSRVPGRHLFQRRYFPFAGRGVIISPDSMSPFSRLLLPWHHRISPLLPLPGSDDVPFRHHPN